MRRAHTRRPRFLQPAVAVFALTVAVVAGITFALSGGGGDDRVAVGGLPELDPRPGQFVLIETRHSYTDERSEAAVYHTRTWQPVEQRHGTGITESTGEDTPAWTAPEGVPFGRTECPELLDIARVDYTYLSGLPEDPAAMRTWLEQRMIGNGRQVDFWELEPLLHDTYLPPAQRRALFEAIKTLPGVRVSQNVADGAGRTGVALGIENQGVGVAGGGTTTITDQLIFDPVTYTFLGVRTSGEGAGTRTSARTAVSLVDAPEAVRDGGCLVAPDPAPTPSESANSWATPQPSPTTTVPDEELPQPPPESISPTPIPDTVTFTPEEELTITSTLVPDPTASATS